MHRSFDRPSSETCLAMTFLRTLLALPGLGMGSLAGNPALAIAMAAPLGLATAGAEAQLGRPIPTPVSAKDFEAMLRDAGLPESVRDVALPSHETYFARFREFESREVDPALDRGPDAPFDLVRTVDDARRDAERRKRLFARAAQLDGQLVDEVGGLLVADEALLLEKVRSALARRRAATAAPSGGFGARAETFDLRRTSAMAALEPARRSAIAATLDAYDAELTRLLERVATAALERPVRAAELREERGVGAPSDSDPAAGEAWFARMQEIQRDASEELVAARQRVRRLHRDVLGQLEATLGPAEVRALRAELVNGAYPLLFRKDAFAAAVAEANALRAKGRLDDAQWSAATAIIETHAIAERPLVEALMDLSDRTLASEGALPFGGGGNEFVERARDLRTDLEDLASRDAAALLAAIGASGPDPQVARQVDAPEGMPPGGSLVVGEAAVSIGVMGGDGEMVVLSGDELAEGLGGISFLGLSGGSSGVARPMGADELDALAGRLGFGKDDRPIFDEIVGRCAEARSAAEAAQPARGGGMLVGGGDGDVGSGGISISLSIGEDGQVVADSGGGGDPEKLAAAIESAEERMFDELRAAVASERVEAAEAARRARARVRLLVGERGAHAADLTSIADKAAIGDAARAAIAEELRAWDEASVGAIRAMRDELRELGSRRTALIEQASRPVEPPDVGLAGGGTAESGVATQAFQIDSEVAEELSAIERRASAAREKVGESNRRSLDALVDRLAGDPAAQKALRRSYLRAVNPAIYRIPRDLSGAFVKALAIEGLAPGGRTEVERLRDEWIESRETLCESFLAACEAEAKARATEAARDPGSGGPIAIDGFLSAEESMRERRRLRADLEQLEATIFRRLGDLLLVEVGVEKAKAIGELPAPRRSGMIQFGN